jgi:hypothetical protein
MVERERLSVPDAELSRPALVLAQRFVQRWDLYAHQLDDGTSISIEIPAIVDRDLWKRNQARIERNKELSTRNAGGVYLLQGLVRCGDCGAGMAVHRKRFGYVGKKRRFPIPVHHYICRNAMAYPEEPHPRPFRRYGRTLDWLVWRRIVDYGIKQPELIKEQVQARQAELQAQGDSVNGDIVHAHHRLAEVDSERAFYQRQAARGKLTEAEFDARMEETEDARRYWLSELARLKELRDDRDKVQAGLDYATKLLATIHKELPRIDIPYKGLKKLPKEGRNQILKARRDIVRALVDSVVVYADGRVIIEGLLDGSEAAQFDLADLSTPSSVI